jgi:Asp-tRNA(Asn)/Glu-tRNA(Gln) amidotransferase A subunit family amidase
MDRRTLFQLVSVLSVARAQQPPAAQAPKATREQLSAALQLLSLNFDGKQQETMLASVNRNLAAYERLRKIDIPLDTEPAFTFHPGAPGRRPVTGKARFQPLARRAPKTRAWKSVEDLAFHSVAELAPLVRARLVTSAELTEMYLARLKKYGPKLHCVITLTEDLARRQAARADEEIRRGKYRGPLHGIPWGAKDLFATKDIRTTWGAEPFREQVIPYDATVVKRLEQAGAVLAAKLSMGALAQGGLWFGGMTRTPWKPEQTSSGSSAGSAAAAAAGLVGFTLGTETLGSIISPSIRCGTVGLRPTYGRVSRYGAMGLSWTMDKIGPICRAVEDCALVLNAIYGPDGRDRSVEADPFHWEPRRPLSQLRVGVIQKAFDAFKDEEKKVYDQALADLKRLGVSMTPVELDDSMAQTLRFLLVAEAAAAFDDITRDNRVAQLRGQAAGDWPNTFRSSRLIPAVEYIRAQRGRTLLQQRVEKTFEAFDVIVTPPSAALTTTNLTGHPQVVLPCGFVDGMPRSLSFLGRLYDEGAPLRLALAYERATEHHTKRPPMEKLDAFDPAPTEPKPGGR